jgi:two-component system sensor histidine kinase/response regulator
MNQPSLLVIDDEPDNFDVIEACLAQCGYDLHYSSSGQEALDSLSIFQPDIILLDVMMPKLSGIEVCQQLKNSPDWQAIPIIMVTALSTKEDLARCLEAGADDFISKPFNSIELRARVQSLVRIKRQYDHLKNLAQLQINTIDLLQNNLRELRSNLFATLPHELNTPLNGIAGVITLMIDRYDTLNAEEMRLLLLLAQSSAQRLETLTQKFLTYAELELITPTDELSTLPRAPAEPILVFPLMQAIASQKAEKMNRKTDLWLDLNYPKDLKIAMIPNDLDCLLEELLDNAFKFSQPGTLVTLTAESDSSGLHFRICDRGRGMTQEQITQIGAFQQFERQTYAQQGLGLGLKIVKKIIELYGGELNISSVYQQATQIDITLPLG